MLAQYMLSSSVCPSVCLSLAGYLPSRKASPQVTTGLADSNGNLPPACGWLIVTCGLNACTPGSAPGPALVDEYGKPLPFFYQRLSLSQTTTNAADEYICRRDG